MSLENSSDNFARVISIISLIVAILAVAIPYYQSERQFEEEVVINLSNGCAKESEIKLIQAISNVYGVVQIPYNYTISNNGNRTSSIIELVTAQINNQGQQSSFSGMKGDIIDENGNKVILPININSGESKSFTFYIGAFIDPEVYNVLDSLKLRNKYLTCELATKTLGRKGKDIFNNAISYQEFQGGEYIITVSEKVRNSPTFLIYNKTSRGQEIVAKYNKYIIE